MGDTRTPHGVTGSHRQTHTDTGTDRYVYGHSERWTRKYTESHTQTHLQTHTCSRHMNGNGHVTLTRGVRATCGRPSCSFICPLLGSGCPALSLSLFRPHPSHSSILLVARETSLRPPLLPLGVPLHSGTGHAEPSGLCVCSPLGLWLWLRGFPPGVPAAWEHPPTTSSTVSGCPLSTFLQGSSWGDADRRLVRLSLSPGCSPWEGTSAWFSFPAETPRPGQRDSGALQGRHAWGQEMPLR